MTYLHSRPGNLPSTFLQISSNISSTAPRPIFRNIISHLLGQLSSIPSEYIFTHPNGWEGVQQQLYRRAIECAGLIGTPQGQSRVHLLTEGEASLHFCVPNLLNLETAIQVAPQGVVIIDAGGGTIDLSMFSMSSTPISGEEIAPAECMQLSPTAEFLLAHLYPFLGRLQGAVFVTRRAGALLQSWWLFLLLY
jgi:molecular chaperone DnaK (HSP70)